MANGYGGPNPKPSGQDPRGRLQNQGGYMQQRYENQQGPFASQLARDYGRGSETDYQNQGDIMNRYRGFLDSGGGDGGGGFNASHVSWKDPFKSYGGYEEFSKTGGYSPGDIANMRSRGTSPVRAAYANAEREVSRGRSLQGGYSPNAAAAQIKMAREQSQSGADAMQNVEAGLAEARNRGRLSGLGGMAGIEGQRLGAQLDAGKFNAMANMNAEQSRSDAASEGSRNRLLALQGMGSLYGTTPGMTNMFANQLNQSIGQGGQMGIYQQNADYNAQQLPGAWDNTMGKIGDVMDMYGAGSTAAYPWLNNRKKQQQPQGPLASNPYPMYSQTPGQAPGYQQPYEGFDYY